MKLGIGFYQKMLTKENFRYARQMGCTHVVAHLTDYHTIDRRIDLDLHKEMYSLENLLRLKREINEEGLEFHAIENFCPAHWHDILLDGPKKMEQLDEIKMIIRNAGIAGISTIGYNFSIAGVWGLTEKPAARGKAMTAVFHDPDHTPVPNGMVWNMIYHNEAEEGILKDITHEELWIGLLFS